MNKCNRDFLTKNNINPDLLNTKIYSTKEINYIVDMCGFYNESEEKQICMENLVGFDYSQDASDYLDVALDNFFDELGDGYHSRSVGMLDYNALNVVEKLQSSFKKEPIKTKEVENEKYIVSTNGMHRFFVLRLLYLNAKSKCSNSEELEELKKRFTIPVSCKKVDYLKTYCKFLIRLFQPAFIMDKIFKSVTKLDDQYLLEIYSGWDDTRSFTISREEYAKFLSSITNISRVYENFKEIDEVKVKYFDGTEKNLNDEQLLSLTRDILLNCPDLNEKIELYSLKNTYERFDSFKKFIDTYFNDILSLDKKGVIDDDSRGM